MALKKKPQVNGLQHRNTKNSCDRKATPELGPDVIPQLEPIAIRHLLLAAGMSLPSWEVLPALKERSCG